MPDNTGGGSNNQSNSNSSGQSDRGDSRSQNLSATDRNRGNQSGGNFKNDRQKASEAGREDGKN